MMRKPPFPDEALGNSRSLRQRSTDAERKLWLVLRGSNLEGIKFRRQHPIPPYTADFYSDAARLVIEIDGSQHDDVNDRSRTEYMQRQGIEVIRFWDNDVLLNLEGVVDAILNSIACRTLTPTPLPEGEGL